LTIRRRRSKQVPDKQKVAEFKEYLLDPNMRAKNKAGKSKIALSEIYRKREIYNPEPRGFTIDEMASAYNELFQPSENDEYGCPSIESKNGLKHKILYENKKHKPNLELHATPCINHITGKRERRYHINKDVEDVRKQTDQMYEIANRINQSAGERLKAVEKPLMERMTKVELLDEYFKRD
jgi:ASC-1-like (ASCH) protein